MKLKYLGAQKMETKETDFFSVPLKHPLNNSLWEISSLSFASQCLTTCPCRHGIFFRDWTKVNLTLAQRSRNRDLKQKGTKEHKKDQKTTPVWHKPQIISTVALHWSTARTNTAEAMARTENKRNVVCGKYPGKLNRNKYSTVKRYICFVNVTRVRKSNGCFHEFKSMLNTNYINTFSEHTGSSVCYF